MHINYTFIIRNITIYHRSYIYINLKNLHVTLHVAISWYTTYPSTDCSSALQVTSGLEATGVAAGKPRSTRFTTQRGVYMGGFLDATEVFARARVVSCGWHRFASAVQRLELRGLDSRSGFRGSYTDL